VDAAGDGLGARVPLADVAVGRCVRVLEIGAGPAMVRRCLALGITVGSELEIRRRRGRGVVVANGGNRVAIGAEVAAQIVTEPVG